MQTHTNDIYLQCYKANKISKISLQTFYPNLGIDGIDKEIGSGQASKNAEEPAHQ